jgi:hypothetical protein
MIHLIGWRITEHVVVAVVVVGEGGIVVIVLDGNVVLDFDTLGTETVVS